MKPHALSIHFLGKENQVRLSTSSISRGFSNKQKDTNKEKPWPPTIPHGLSAHVFQGF